MVLDVITVNVSVFMAFHPKIFKIGLIFFFSKYFSGNNILVLQVFVLTFVRASFKNFIVTHHLTPNLYSMGLAFT